MFNSPLLIHWDGKWLTDITGNKEVVDRIAVLVTGGQVEQLLAVPEVEGGTVALETTSGPDIPLFKRFQPHWIYIDKDKFETAFEPWSVHRYAGGTASGDEIVLCWRYLQQSHTSRWLQRATLALPCLPWWVDRRHVRLPCTRCHAQSWMDGKGHLFLQDVPIRNQIKFTTHEVTGLNTISLFVSVPASGTRHLLQSEHSWMI